jgi:ankyrin repeat protein
MSQSPQLHCATDICDACAAVALSSCCYRYPLQGYAMKSGPACSRIVQLLLQHGANPGCTIAANDKSTAGITPMHLLACWSPAQGADDDEDANQSSGSGRAGSSSRTSSNKGKRAQKAAAQQQRMEQQLLAFTYLQTKNPLSKYAVKAATLHNAVTPLTFAAFTGAYEIAEQLLSAGADVNQPRLKDAARPLDLAAEYQRPRLACLLLERGAEVGAAAGSRLGGFAMYLAAAGCGRWWVPSMHGWRACCWSVVLR